MHTDIDGDTLNLQLASWRQSDGMSARTANGYLQVFGQFMKWLVRNSRLPTDPLARILPVFIDEDKITKKRHALSVAMQRKLLATALTGETVFHMTGLDRYLIYSLALETGLRADEIRTLTAGSFDLTNGRSRIRVRSADTKNKKADVLPLRPVLAEAMRKHLVRKLPTAPAFPRMPYSYDTADMLRCDLAVAGIPEKTDSSEIIDFHALRHTFCTNIGNSSVPINTARALMRHSSIAMTEKYMHSDERTKADAVACLPDILGEADDDSDEVALIGTNT